MNIKPDSAQKTGVCWTVVRRTLSVELLDLLSVLALVVGTQGRALRWNWSAPSFTAYSLAVSRLRKAGLIARRRTGGKTPFMELTRQGEGRLSDEIRPERWWNQKWDGCWHVLMYDVPEKERRYREALRGFLRRMRMGGLQRSVWIACRDVRPAFADLKQAASIADFAVLLEARTVLGQSGQELAAQAWDFDRLQTMQRQYIRECAARTAKDLEAGRAPGEIVAAMRREQAEYFRMMEDDPLLPRALWPPGYEGPAVVEVFRTRLATLAAHL